MPPALPPLPPGEPPQVIVWFKVYTAFLCLLYLGTAALSVLFFNEDFIDPSRPKEVSYIIGFVLLGLGLALLIVCAVPLFIKAQPWLWTYNLIIICLGMTGCTVVASIPLLIFWLKPETKRYFGRPE